MRIIKIDRKENFFEVVPESLDDLWHLEKLIEAGDAVSGKSERKVKAKYEGGKPKKEDIFVELQVEGAEFHRPSGQLRVSGIIVAGTPEEFIELKAHHSIEFEPGRKVKVKKQKLKNHHIDRLEKAKRAGAREKMLLVVLDDEEASFALLKEFGLEDKGRIIAARQGKRYKEEKSSSYFDEIIDKVREINPAKIIFAGPGFTKNNLQKYLDEKDLKLQAFFESANSVGVTGLNELIKSGKIDAVAGEIQLGNETKTVERFFAEVGKDGPAAYGLAEIEKAVQAGAVSELIVGEKFLLGNREKAEELMDSVESARGAVHIISAGHEAGRKLEGIGGIAAILRYKMA